MNTAGPAAVLSWLDRRSTLWAICALVLVLFAITNLPWQLDDYDQAKQAFTSYEMVNEGHWFYQHTPNEKVATKPPLVGWISAAIYGATRNWEIAWRLPSFAAGIALLIALTQTTRRAFGDTSALLAAAAFGLNLLSPRLATLVRTDMPLALIVFSLGWKIWSQIRDARPWDRRDRWQFFLLLTAAMLIKGPIVYAFLLPGIAAFSWRTRREAASGSAWSGWWPWIASLAIFLIWVACGIRYVPGFYDEVVLREFAGRFTETVHRPQPFYFYWPHLLHKLAPWSVLLLVFGGMIWRQRSSLPVSPGMLWLIWWSVGSIVAMSLIPSKRVDRIFPVVAPLCLLLGAQFSALRRRAGAQRFVGYAAAVAVIFSCVYTSGYAAQKLYVAHRTDRGALPAFGRAVRAEAARRHWRYDVIGGAEEGMLLYLERTHFVEIDDAIARWKAGEIDAVVAPEEDAEELLRGLPGATRSPLQSWSPSRHAVPHYIFLTRA